MTIGVDGIGDSRESLSDGIDALIVNYRSACVTLGLFVRDSARNISDRKTFWKKFADKIHSAGPAEKPPPEDGDSIYVRRLDDDQLQVFMTEEARQALADELEYIVGLREGHSRMVLDMALAHAFALFEALVSDVLFAAHYAVPELLRSNAKLTYEEALQFSSRAALVEALARRRVLSIMYDSLESQMGYLMKMFSLDLAATDEIDIDRLGELRDRRNLIMHNNGRASTEYADRHGMEVGEPLPYDPDDAEEDRRMLERAGVLIAQGVRDHLTRGGMLDSD